MELEPFLLQEKTLGELLAETASRYPQNEALIDLDRKFRQTWSEFNSDVNRLAKGLMALGMQRGEKVAVWSTNVPYWITLMFATARIGTVLLTVNTSYREKELAYILEHSQCENICISEGYRDHNFIVTFKKILPPNTLENPLSIKTEHFPFLKRVFFLGNEAKDGLLSIPDIMEMSSQVSDEAYISRQREVRPHDVVNMQYTSGTTGFPKGVMLSHVNILNNGFWIGRIQNFSSQDRLCLPVPLFHCFGCVLGVMAAVNHAVTMVLIDMFNPVHVMASVEKERCTALYGVPSMFLSILEHRSFSKYNLSSLRTGIMAGSVCPEPLLRRAIEQMHMREITNVYGLTEASPGMTQTHADEEFVRRVTTVGKVMPGIEVRVVNPDTMEEVPRGQAGEVICRGYNVMKGYYNMPEETAAAITPDGWLRSGDLGIMDDAGYLVITGRIKDMVIRGGENIYPREIEEFLLGMETVHDVQVVGVASKRYGEQVGAFIIPKENATITPDDVREFCRGKIAWQKVPRYIAIVSEFPMTASGKIQKYRLREIASEMFPDA